MTSGEANTWLPIVYRDFYDVPRAFLVSEGGRTLYFLCAFDEGADEYSASYTVFDVTPAVAQIKASQSWIGLEKAGNTIGRVMVEAVTFDAETTRSAILRSDISELLAE